MRTFVVMVSFLLMYQLGAEAINVIAVYGLHMVDTKFGDAEGNLRFGREVLPWLTAMATASFFVGIWPHRGWFPSASTSFLTVAAASSAFLCTIVALAGIYLAEQLPDSVSAELWPIGWLALLGLPMLCGRKLFTLIRPRT